MGFITSTAAIVNVISLERSLHRHLIPFRAEHKFLSVKIMVSIAFMQSITMSLFSAYLTQTQSRLLYSSLICYEVHILSWFHLHAWPLKEPWLENTEKRQSRAHLQPEN